MLPKSQLRHMNIPLHVHAMSSVAHHVIEFLACHQVFGSQPTQYSSILADGAADAGISCHLTGNKLLKAEAPATALVYFTLCIVYFL